MPLILALLALLRWLTAGRLQLTAHPAASSSAPSGRFQRPVPAEAPRPAPAHSSPGRLQLQVNGRFQRPVPAAGSAQPHVNTPFLRLSQVVDFALGFVLLAVFLALAVLFPPWEL